MLGRVPQIDIADDTFVVADPGMVAALVADPLTWSGWWPDLRLEVTADRGRMGMQWAVTGAVAGSMEVWLEPYADGVLVHYYLRADPAGGEKVRTIGERRRRDWKRQIHQVKDRLEAGREPGRSREEQPDVKDILRPAE
jgi:hypothetical protein